MNLRAMDPKLRHALNLIVRIAAARGIKGEIAIVHHRLKAMNQVAAVAGMAIGETMHKRLVFGVMACAERGAHQVTR